MGYGSNEFNVQSPTTLTAPPRPSSSDPPSADLTLSLSLTFLPRKRIDLNRLLIAVAQV
jgi:hypothetical protein